MDRIKYEEAEQNKKNAQKNEQKMQERIRELTKKRKASKQQLNAVNKKVGDLAHGRSQIEGALKECEEIRNKTFPKVKENVQEASKECSKTFQSSAGPLGILSVHADDLNQTQNELNDILRELTERLTQVKTQEAEMNTELTRLKREVTGFDNEITACKKKENFYARQVQEYTAQMNRYR